MRPHPLYLALLLALPATAQVATPDGGRHDQVRARELDELVVTASPLQPGSEDVVKPVEVLAGEALDRAKAGTLGETVARSVGVQSSFFGAGVGRPIVRGQEGARVQVLEGGASSMDVSTVSADHAVGIEPFLADQIEILKGPSTLLYGSGAVAGAVNVVDGRIPEMLPDAAVTGRAELRGNTGADEVLGMARVDGGAGALAWHADAFARDADDYDIPGRAEIEHEDSAVGRLPNSSLETEGGAFGASWIGEQGFLGASISTYRSNYGVPGHAHGHEHEEHEDDEHEDDEHGEEAVRIDLDQTRFDVKGAWLDPFTGAESLRLRVARNDYEHVELEGEDIGTRFDNTGTEARLELVLPDVVGWRAATGVQLGRRDFAAIGEEAFVPPSVSDDRGVFALAERTHGDWQFEVGARYDDVAVDPQGDAERDFEAVSASVGTQWTWTQAVHLSLGYDRAQRAPTAEELFSDGAHIATQSYEIGDATLREETANQLEFGLHLHTGPLSGKLAVFQNRYDDFITLLDTGAEIDDLPVRAWTQADATFRGLEAEATLQLADNASGQWSLRMFGDKVRATLDEGGALPRIVPARVGLSFAWERDGWRASAGAVKHADQRHVAAFETATDGYTLVDAHLAYHWDTARTGWEVFLDGTNLTDQQARAHTSFLKDLAPLPGRSVAFGIRAFF